MDLPDADEDLDLTLRHITRQLPEQLARALLPPGAVISSVSWAALAAWILDPSAA